MNRLGLAKVYHGWMVAKREFAPRRPGVVPHSATERFAQGSKDFCAIRGSPLTRIHFDVGSRLLHVAGHETGRV